MKFLLDTNFVLVPGKFKVDIFSELEKFGKPELFTLDSIIIELKKLASGKGPDPRTAKLGLIILKKYKVKIIKVMPKKADAGLLELSADGFAVCTLDRELMAKIKKSGGKVITLRQKKYLEER